MNRSGGSSGAFVNTPAALFKRKEYDSSCALLKRKEYDSSRQISIARIAIVGTVPSTFPNGLLAAGIKPTDISLEKAVAQHAAYTVEIARCPSITSMLQCSASRAYPDSVFVEDPVVVLTPETAFMGQLGHATRMGESDALAEVIRRAGITVQRSNVRMDGGDVLQACGFVFVGVSERTEMAAVDALQAAFNVDAGSRNVIAPKVIPLKVQEALHLKSVVTWAGGTGHTDSGFMVAPDTEIGHALMKSIEDSTRRAWEVAWIPEDEKNATNVLHIPGTGEGTGRIFVQGVYQKAVEIVKKKVSEIGVRATVVEVDTSEFVKANGALTCMSIII